MTGPRRTSRIVPGVQGARQDYDDALNAPEPGQVVCLVEWRDDNGRHGAYLSTDPRTNLSRAPLWEGWLGTTNNVSRHALGAYRVVSVVPWDDGPDDAPRWRVSLTATDAPETDR